MNKNVFIFSIVALLLVAGGFLGVRYGKMLPEKWSEIESLISKYAPSGMVAFPPTEPLEITLPETTEEPKEPAVEEESAEELFAEELPFQPAPAPEKEEPKLSLSEIQEQIEDVSDKVDNISQMVAILVGASGEELPPLVGEEVETARLAEIQEKVSDITEQINIISEQIAELVEASDGEPFAEGMPGGIAGI